ncbi:MAG TPA: glycosyltransferase [Chromatiaceae bacterium]|nr:glycosyltransferase [Chromatiaceae bacterium]
MVSSEPRKLLFVNYSLAMGGIETLLLELCRAMKSGSRYDPAVCVFDAEGKLQKEFYAIGVPVHVLQKKRSRDYFLPLRVRRLIQQENYDLVHAHNQVSWLYGGLGAVLANTPLVYTEHTSLAKFEPSQQKNLKMVLRLLGRRTQLVTTVAKHLIPSLLQDIGIPSERIRNVYNGIEPAPYQIKIDREEKLRELGLPFASRIIGIVASLTDAKDHATLLRAFAQVLPAIPEARLLIVGEGPLEESMRSLAHTLEIGSNVHFLGVRRDIPELLQLFDVFTLSSLIEGLPISLLEAMASACPVVATRIPGVDELVSQDSGLLVPHSSPDEQAKALVRVLTEDGLADSLGSGGRQRVLEKFSFEAMVQAYLSCYDEVLEFS